jgi:hypothetical protein
MLCNKYTLIKIVALAVAASPISLVDNHVSYAFAWAIGIITSLCCLPLC